MDCRYCNKSACIKKGKRKNIQRYYCKKCEKYFQNKYRYHAYDLSTNNLIKNLLKEGCGIRSISRILKISCGTVLSRMLKIGNRIEIPYFKKLGCKFEVDEMWAFIKRKEDFTWITYADIWETLHGRKMTKDEKKKCGGIGCKGMLMVQLDTDVDPVFPIDASWEVEGDPERAFQMAKDFAAEREKNLGEGVRVVIFAIRFRARGSRFRGDENGIVDMSNFNDANVGLTHRQRFDYGYYDPNTNSWWHATEARTEFRALNSSFAAFTRENGNYNRIIFSWGYTVLPLKDKK